MNAKLALTIWISLIAVVSLVPVNQQGPDWIPHLDKLVHLIIYGVLAYLALNVLSSKFSTFYCLLWALSGSILYGFLIECAQGLSFTNRYFDYFDIIANIIGSLIGSLIFYLIRKKDAYGRF